MIDLTPDVRLLWAPSKTYRQISGMPAGAAPRAWLGAFARAAAPVVVIAVAAAVSATGRVTWALALSGVLCWSFIALLQTLVAAVAIGRAHSRVGWPRAIELFFLGHAAWSLWLLLAAVIAILAPRVSFEAGLLTAVIPAIWTAVVVFAFFRHVLGLTPRQSAARTVVYQALMYLAILTYIGWAVQVWPRILGQQVP